MDPVTLSGTLLVVGPIAGALGVGSPPLLRAWTAPRDEHLATVRAHRTAWALANSGFVAATVTSAAGLAVLAVVGLPPGAPDPLGGAALVAVAVAYAIGGALWCAVLGIRERTTPALAELAAAGAVTEPAEGLVGAAIGGLFAAFVLITAGALVALGAVMLAAGGVAAPVAALAIALGLLAFGVQLRTGDFIPAVLYIPTLVLGLALLAGWT